MIIYSLNATIQDYLQVLFLISFFNDVFSRMSTSFLSMILCQYVMGPFNMIGSDHVDSKVVAFSVEIVILFIELFWHGGVYPYNDYFRFFVHFLHHLGVNRAYLQVTADTHYFRHLFD